MLKEMSFGITNLLQIMVLIKMMVMMHLQKQMTVLEFNSLAGKKDERILVLFCIFKHENTNG